MGALMSAATTPRNTTAFGNDAVPLQTPYPIAAAEVIPQGVMVALSSTGYLKNASADNTLVVCGVTESASPQLTSAGLYDNTTGGNAAFQVPVSQSTYWMGNASDSDACTQATVGLPVYVVDNQTVADNSNTGARPFAGTCVGISSTLGVLVQFSIADSQQHVFSAQTNSLPLTVANGGTGDTTLTAYSPLFGGTTATGAVQKGTAGTLGDPLLSGGASAIGAYGKLAPLGAKVAAIGGFGIEFTATVVLADSAGGTTTNVAVPVKCEVVRIQVIKNTTLSASASDLVQVKNHGSGTALCGDLLLNVAASTIVNPTTLVAAQAVIALADGIDLVQPAHVTNNGCTVILSCIARA